MKKTRSISCCIHNVCSTYISVFMCMCMSMGCVYPCTNRNIKKCIHNESIQLQAPCIFVHSKEAPNKMNEIFLQKEKSFRKFQVKEMMYKEMYNHFISMHRSSTVF